MFFFRTYSVDSSESSSDEANDEKDVREEVEELTKVLSDLVRENRELEVIYGCLLKDYLFFLNITRHSFELAIKSVLRTENVRK